MRGPHGPAAHLRSVGKWSGGTMSPAMAAAEISSLLSEIAKLSTIFISFPKTLALGGGSNFSQQPVLG